MGNDLAAHWARRHLLLPHMSDNHRNELLFSLGRMPHTLQYLNELHM